MPASLYLDHNATTPMRPAAVAAVNRALGIVGNPSSVHRFGRLARSLVEDAREQVALLVETDPAWVIFTSGGTEANTLALTATRPAAVLVSAIEHASVGEAMAGAVRIPVTAAGVIDMNALDMHLRAAPPPALVSVMLANNETGALQPVAAIAAMARRLGAFVHCDAVQAAGKLPIKMGELGVQMLSLSAHKLGGPPGVGALVVDPALPFAPLLRGGGQERRRRAGTENMIGIAGFGAAAVAAARLDDTARLAPLRDRIESEILAASPTTRIFGTDTARLPNTSCLATPGLPAETQVIAFDLRGIAISAGAACSSGKIEISHVLRAMGVGEDLARTAVRVSLGWTTTADDVDRFVAAWKAIHHHSLENSGEVCSGKDSSRRESRLAPDTCPTPSSLAISG